VGSIEYHKIVLLYCRLINFGCGFKFSFVISIIFLFRFSEAL
jgi:hypothetical protein